MDIGDIIIFNHVDGANWRRKCGVITKITQSEQQSYRVLLLENLDETEPTELIDITEENVQVVGHIYDSMTTPEYQPNRVYSVMAKFFRKYFGIQE